MLYMFFFFLLDHSYMQLGSLLKKAFVTSLNVVKWYALQCSTTSAHQAAESLCACEATASRHSELTHSGC